MGYLVIDIGGTYTKYAVMDQEAGFYKSGKVPTVQDSQEHFLDMLAEIYEENKAMTEGIAISSAGIIDNENGYMHTAGSVFCVSELPIARVLERRCHVPVTVENDARCAALAEVWKGSLTDCRNAIVILCGTAIGGAVILDREVLHGKDFIAGEFSYILTESDDAMNEEKTLARSCGVPALLHMVSEVKKIPETKLDGETVFAMANHGDTDVTACIRRYANRLAVHIMNCQFMINPDRVAIGGGISAQPLFLKLLCEEVVRLHSIYPHVHSSDIPVPEIVPCRFFNDSNLIGALYVHMIHTGKMRKKLA